jgi:DNA-binding beta-propeller fold protein YncE
MIHLMTRFSISATRLRPVLVALVVGVVGVSPARATDHVFVVTSDGSVGNCAAVEIESPWAARTGLEPVGPYATVRHFAGLHWIVNGAPPGGSSTDDVQAIDPLTFETVRYFSVGAGSSPRDIVLADAAHAWVSRYDSRWLLEIDPTSGAPPDSIDLGGFGDADGLPEMAWMALDGTHLFVQLQRLDRPGSGATVPPALLTVIDVAGSQWRWGPSGASRALAGAIVMLNRNAP